MHENAQGILNYLPIEPAGVTRYIQHLYGSFEALYNAGDPIKSFSILPFHLLFMLAVQYKVHRISAWDNDKYQNALKHCRTYGNDSMSVLEKNAPILDTNGVMPRDSSVRNLSLIQEGDLFSFFDLKNQVTKKAKKLIRIRGTYAHANGNIEQNIDERIGEYLEVLRAVQSYMATVNIGSQSWATEFEVGLSPLDGFFRDRFLSSQFSPYDFGDVVGNLFESPKLDSKQRDEIVNMGLEFAHDQTVHALRTSATNNTNSERRLNAIRALSENYELDENLKVQIRQNNTNPDILALLK